MSLSFSITDEPLKCVYQIEKKYYEESRLFLKYFWELKVNPSPYDFFDSWVGDNWISKEMKQKLKYDVNWLFNNHWLDVISQRVKIDFN